jgi:hypothetical protein
MNFFSNLYLSFKITRGAYYLRLLSALIFIINMCACAAFDYTIPQSNIPTLLSITLCKGVVSGETPSEVQPYKQGNTFKMGEDEIWLLVCLGNLEGHHTMKWRWYTPDGSLFLDTGDFNINPDGGYHRLVTVWDNLNINNIEEKKSVGKWMVAIFLDEKLIGTNYFFMSKES